MLTTMFGWQRRMCRHWKFTPYRMIFVAFGCTALIFTFLISHLMLTTMWPSYNENSRQHNTNNDNKEKDQTHSQIHKYYSGYLVFDDGRAKSYNGKYPLSSIDHSKQLATTYSIMAIADLDTDSKKSAKKYVSYLLRGSLTVGQLENKDFSSSYWASVQFDGDSDSDLDSSSVIEISTQYAYGDRGMELSELVTFNGKLYSCDDRTGIVYQIININTSSNDKRNNGPQAIPWVILPDGDGMSTSKGFKCEWMTVKENKLYVGGFGKEWTTPTGEFSNNDPQWVKVIGHLGDVAHLDWKENYDRLRRPGHFTFPGYMIFESGVWSERDKLWYFLPRRASRQPYDEKLDERRATNLLITCDEQFRGVTYKEIGAVNPVRGYSSFKFVPGTQERLVLALKSEENAGRTRTFVTVFDKTTGEILVADKLVSSKFKFEGIEFI